MTECCFPPGSCGNHNCDTHAKNVNGNTLCDNNMCTDAKCCTVDPPPKTCADINAAGGGAFDCSGHAKNIHASPAGITCADQSTGCTNTECCTVVPSKTCADINAAGGGAFDCSGDAKDINASPAGITCAAQNTGCTASECCTVTSSTTSDCSTSDTNQLTSACKCDSGASTNECVTNKYCWVDNTCNNAAKSGSSTTTPCSKSDTVAVNAACKCDVAASTNECAMSKYCWVDNSCNDAAKITGKCTGNTGGTGDVNCAGETTNTQNKGNMVDGTDAGTCCEAPSGAANGENCAENGDCQSGRCSTSICAAKAANSDACAEDNDCVSNNCAAEICGARRRLLSSKANTGRRLCGKDSSYCMMNSECCEDHYCSGMMCMKKFDEGKGCGRDEECETDHCDPSTYMCSNKGGCGSIGAFCYEADECCSETCTNKVCAEPAVVEVVVTADYVKSCNETLVGIFPERSLGVISGVKGKSEYV